MPRVPLYDSNARPAGMPTPNVTVDARGSLSGGGEALARASEGLGQVAAGIGRIAQAEKSQALAAQVAAADAELQAEITAQLHDRERGLLRTQGEAAIVRADEAYKAIEDKAAKLAGTFRDEQARQQFTLRARGQQEGVKRQGEGHVAHEAQAAKVGKVRALEEQALIAVHANYADPEDRARKAGLVESAMLAALPEGEARDAALATFRQKLDLVALSAAVDDDNLEWAEAYLAQVKDSLGSAGAPIVRQVQRAKKDRAAEDGALRILQGSLSERTGWVDEAAVWAKVDEAPAKGREALRQSVAHRLVAARQAENDQIQEVFRRALGGYQSSGSRGISPADKDWLITRAPEQWERIRGTMQADAERYKRALAERDRPEPTRGQSPEEAAAQVDVMLEIRANPDQYRDATVDTIMALGQERGVHFSSAAIKAIGGNLATVQDGLRKSEAKGGVVRTEEWKGVVENSLNLLGPRMKDKFRRKEAAAALNKRRDDWLNAHNGEDPPRDEVKKWLREDLTYYDGGVFGAARPGFRRPADATDEPLPAGEQPFPPVREEMQRGTVVEEGLDLREGAAVGSFDAATPAPRPRKASSIREISAGAQKRIREIIRQRGQSATDAEILRVYNAAIPREAAEE